jgi:predicted transcriptional regulator
MTNRIRFLLLTAGRGSIERALRQSLPRADTPTRERFPRCRDVDPLVSAMNSPARRTGRRQGRMLLSIGALEADVMRVVWTKGRVSVRDVFKVVGPGRKIAYTTVMTALANLAAKGLVECDRSSLAYTYTARASRLEIAFSALDTVVDVILAGDRQPLIEYLRDKSSGEVKCEMDRRAASSSPSVGSCIRQAGGVTGGASAI